MNIMMKRHCSQSRFNMRRVLIINKFDIFTIDFDSCEGAKEAPFVSDLGAIDS